jgi:NADH-quinone oxidoreductase subunit J
VSLDQIFFYFFGGIAILGAVLTVTRRNPVHSAVFLITALLATAGIFLLQRAEFLFAAQIILYVGGIMVLFIFVIMLVDIDVALRRVQFTRQRWVALLLTLVLGAQVALALWMGREGFRLPAARPASTEGNTELIGRVLFQNYMLPFEIASILLLVALVGAVMMAKRKT